MSITDIATKPDFTPEQMKLIIDTVAKGATQNELKFFLYRAKVLGLDPLRPGQIYFIKYGSGPGATVIGIDGFRSMAVKTGKVTGVKRGVLKDDAGKLLGGWAEVSRQGWAFPAREEVPFDEYSTGKGNWYDMPETMIKKVAEAAALRMAFPDELGGLYADVEMEKTALRPGGVFAEQPPLDGGDGNTDDGIYRIPFGSFVKRKLDEVDIGQLRDYVQSLLDRAELPPTNKKRIEIKPGGVVGDFISKASAHIAAFENSPIEKETGENFEDM